MKIKKIAEIILMSLLFFCLFNYANFVNAASELTIIVRENPTFIYVNKSKTIQVNTKLDGKDISDAKLSYVSNKPNIVTVNENTGELTGKKKGTAKITVTAKYDNNLTTTKTFEVHVRELLPNIKTFNNAPKISFKASQDKYDDVTLLISDEDGLNSKNIQFFEGILVDGKNTYDASKEITNQILAKEPEVTKKSDTKNIKYRYVISKDYLSKTKNKLYIKIKDDTGKYFNTHFIIKKNGTHYTLDAAPCVGYWGVDLKNKKISFVVKDYGGVSSVKVYDHYSNNKLILSKNNFSDINTLITVNLSDLKEKKGKYSLRIMTKDNNKVNINHAFRTIEFSLDTKETEKPEETEKPASSTKGTQATVFKGLSATEAASKIGKIVQEDAKKSGILASVTAAQFILESGYGTSELAQNANNCFGMKKNLSGNTWSGSSWDGKSVYTKKTQEEYGGQTVTITAEFRKYPCIEDSIADHSAYLLGAMNGNKKRYAGLKDEKNYRKAVQIIKNGGYATSSSYVESVCSIIEKYNLTQYDNAK